MIRAISFGNLMFLSVYILMRLNWNAEWDLYIEQNKDNWTSSEKLTIPILINMIS